MMIMTPSNHQRFPNNVFLLISKAPPPKILFITALVFSSYCMYSAYVTVARTSMCVERGMRAASLLGFQNSIRPFENDVLLEYTSFKEMCNATNWNNKDCYNGSCTRVFVKGKKYIKSARSSSTKSKHATAWPRRRSIPSPTSYNFTLISDELMTCKDITRLWNDNEYKQFKQIPTRGDSQVNDGIVEKIGTTTKFFHPNTFRIRTQEAFFNTTGYLKLKKHFKKRSRLNWNMEGLPHLFGACVDSDSVRFVLEDIEFQGTTICDLRKSTERNFTESECHHLTKLQEFFKSYEDINAASLKFSKNLLCLLIPFEKKNLFIEDFHGSQFTITSKEMNIVANDLDNILYYGKRNIYSSNICSKDIYCPFPLGAKWQNESANRAIYNLCHDHVPTCSENRCVGFNASLHLCGIARWIRPILHNLKSEKEKGRLSHLLNLLSTPYAETRMSAEKACNEAANILHQYEYDKKHSRSKQKSFHVGRPPHLMKKT